VALTQILYFFHIVCLCAGSMVVLLSFMLYARRRDYWLRFYLALVLAFFLLMFFQTLAFFYNLASLPDARVLSRTFIGLFLLVLNFMVFLVPYFATWLTRLPWKRGMQALFIPLSCAYFALAVLYSFFFPNNGLVYAGLVLIFAVAVLYSSILIVRRREKIAEGTMRRLCLSFVVLSVVFCPLIMLDAILSYVFSGFATSFLSGLLAFPLYFLWFSVVSLVYLVGYFAKPAPAARAGIDEKKLAEFKITEREKEIILLLQQGLTYKEIGAKLFISVHTVNNHVANIYSKSGASNRIDLLRCLS
jgi:DNA-binding CsgD family transcriptional regulator